MVWVRPGILPAIMMVIPKSPSERANANAAAAKIDRRARGTVTRQNTFHSEAPRLRAARAKLGSRVSNDARVNLISSGGEGKSAASVAACQVKTSGEPNNHS